LLDWLAVELVESGWDVQALLTTIVQSATYRQSSVVRPDLAASDPWNRTLARGPRVRLSAEGVRDAALAISGLLSTKLHGPSVFPPQPEGLWRAAFNGNDRNWETSMGEDRYRRALYTFYRRTAPYPAMDVFDAPSRETCTVRRIATNTPLQAFVTLNDPAFVEAARALAARIENEGGDTVTERVEYGLWLARARPPEPEQVAILARLYASEFEHYVANVAAAAQLAGDSLGASDDTEGAVRRAAWTVVANVLLNLDGVLVKD